jgi:hypothetical protein
MVLFFMMPYLLGVPNFDVLTISDKTIEGMEYYGECMLFSYLLVSQLLYYWAFYKKTRLTHF